MEPSCGQPPAPVLPRRKKKMARKEKAPSIPFPLPSNEPNKDYATGRTDYEMEEYMKTLGRMWDRIEARYNSVKPSWAYKRNKDRLHKCWDPLKVHVNNFSYIYTKNRDGRGNGESMEDVIQKSMTEYQSQNGQFKFYNVWLILKDKTKFDGGILITSSAAKRTKNTFTGGYTSSGSSPVDLKAEPEGSSDTTTSTFRRPIGTKTAKAQAQGKAKAAAFGSAPPQATPLPSTQLVASALEEFAGFREMCEYKFILDV